MKKIIGLLTLLLLISAVPIQASTLLKPQYTTPVARTRNVTKDVVRLDDNGSDPIIFGAERGTEPNQDIVILATSDVHCGIDQNFTYAGLEQIREVYEKNGDYTILVDCGDATSGVNYRDYTVGEVMIGLMNDLEYDLAIPGNHEFDYGVDQFLELSEKANFPYISCNFNKNREQIFDPSLIIDANGTKIGFVGVTTPTTIKYTTRAYYQDNNGKYIYDFLQKDKTGQALYDAVQDAVDNVREEGAEYVFLLSHLGKSELCAPWTYADVVSNTSGIDAVFDGHGHDTYQLVEKNIDGKEVPRMGLGTELNGIGYVRISAEDGSISPELFTWTNTPTFTYLAGIESTFVDKAMEEMGMQLGETVMTSPFDLVIDDPDEGVRIIRREETNLGDLVTDAFRTVSGADVAIYCGGGIQAGMPAGVITYKDLMNVLPYGNSMYVVEVTGQQILDALEWGARDVPEENGGFLQVSGLTYEIHTDIESFCKKDESGMFSCVEGDYRVKNVMVGGEALDCEKTYSLSSTNYTLLEHGDGFTMFDDCKVVQEGSNLDLEVLINYLTESLNGVVPDEYKDPYGQGRIIALSDR